MNRVYDAKARTNGHQPCQRIPWKTAPAISMAEKSLSTIPPKPEEGKLRQKMAPWKHGLRSKEARKEQKTIKELIKSSTAYAAKKNSLSFFYPLRLIFLQCNSPRRGCL